MATLQDTVRANLLTLLGMTFAQGKALSTTDLYKLARDAALVPDTGKNYGSGRSVYFNTLRP